MLKFHHRLLLLISTITIISFIGLGAIIHNTIYQTLTSNQTSELRNEAHNYVNLLNHNKGQEIDNLADNQQNVVVIKNADDNHVIFSSGDKSKIDQRIDNEANPSDLISKKNENRYALYF